MVGLPSQLALFCSPTFPLPCWYAPFTIPLPLEASASVSLLDHTCLSSPGGVGVYTPPRLWPVSLGADSQSCLLPVSKICSFPSENTCCFLAWQRTGQVKWAVVSAQPVHTAL